MSGTFKRSLSTLCSYSKQIWLYLEQGLVFTVQVSANITEDVKRLIQPVLVNAIPVLGVKLKRG